MSVRSRPQMTFKSSKAPESGSFLHSASINNSETQKLIRKENSQKLRTQENNKVPHRFDRQLRNSPRRTAQSACTRFNK